MKISGIIGQLQDILQKEGDLEVLSSTPCFFGPLGDSLDILVKEVTLSTFPGKPECLPDGKYLIITE